MDPHNVTQGIFKLLKTLNVSDNIIAFCGSFRKGKRLTFVLKLLTNKKIMIIKQFHHQALAYKKKNEKEINPMHMNSAIRSEKQDELSTVTMAK